ncbi:MULTISPECIES: DUF1918 domain-containing protein [unclassified Streptomyces]|uniref:DUF1918 domain-containing protein n=1 Tax=unclassified Streptomyces TaxID=2593676 RepID=UPI0036FA1E06
MGPSRPRSRGRSSPGGGRVSYDVRWSDTGHVTWVFPGPDARVHHYGGEAPFRAHEPVAAAPGEGEPA